MDSFKGVSVVGLSAVIGSGKTSLMTRLQQEAVLEALLPEGEYCVMHVLEPEAMWVDEERDINYLTTFYQDRNRNAHPFQMIVFDTHVTVIEEALERALLLRKSPDQKIVIVVERTMYDQLLFWKKQVADGVDTGSPIHDASYMKIWRRWKQLIPPIALIFHLKTKSLDETMKRLEKRGDTQVTRTYQQGLLNMHDAWYTTPRAYPMEGPTSGVPCVELDASEPYHVDDDALQRVGHLMAESIQRYVI